MDKYVASYILKDFKRMRIGQRVYAQKNELQFHKWYKAKIVLIRRAKRTGAKFPCFWWIIDSVTCRRYRPMEYVIQFQDKSQQVVSKSRLQTTL